jgi:hypothetical protein
MQLFRVINQQGYFQYSQLATEDSKANNGTAPLAQPVDRCSEHV